MKPTESEYLESQKASETTLFGFEGLPPFGQNEHSFLAIVFGHPQYPRYSWRAEQPLSEISL